jgi:hypothetical protein
MYGVKEQRRDKLIKARYNNIKGVKIEGIYLSFNIYNCFSNIFDFDGYCGIYLPVQKTDSC